MVVVCILPHAEFGRNDNREDAPHYINAAQKLKCLLIIPLIVDKAAIAYLIIQSHFGKNMNLVNVALQYSKTIIPKNALQTF